MGNGILYLCVFIYFLALAKHGNCNEIPGNEPTCFSWYDFAQKLLERTITAEMKVTHMESLLGDMEASMKLRETEVNLLKSEIESEQAEMQALVEGVINTAQDQVALLSSVLRDFQGKVNTSFQQFEELSAAGGGAVYIRWGRTVCPENTTTVYTGFAGGSHYTHTGGQSNPVCLPRDPIFSNYKAGEQGSFIYGVEYQDDSATTSAVFGTNVDDTNVSCAVCEAQGRRSKMLVPARNVCYKGWHLEYSGYLMMSHHTHQRTTIECVDANPESIQGQHANNDGQTLHFVEANGQIPSPPYTRGKELTCAICTK